MRVLIAAGGTAGHINPALAIAGAEKILERSVDEAANSDIVDKLVAEL